MQTSMRVRGIDGILASVALLGPTYLAHLIGPALRAAAAPVRRKARRRNYGFRDKRGVLRRTLRNVRITAYYGGKRFKRGRAAVFAGNRNARQAYLVEAGHGGPAPAPPYPYLLPALLTTRALAIREFKANIRRRHKFTTNLYIRRARAAAIRTITYR